MPERDSSAAFDRDFGYLMPFLDRVQAAGEALPLGPRQEIASLLAGERERWMRVRELLAGSDTSAPTTPRSPSPAPAGALASGPLGFTVGTLRRRD